MFEAEMFGVDVNMPHLVLAVIALSIVTTYGFNRAARLKSAATAGMAISMTHLSTSSYSGSCAQSFRPRHQS